MKQTINLNLEDEFMKNLRESLPEPDVMLGKGSMIPFNDTNSGARKILSGTQREHVIPIMNGEVAYITTGTEQQYGDYSSSLLSAEYDGQVIAKISKFQNYPNHHYYLITINDRTQELDIIQRVSYKHNTESYGYMIDNDTLDNLSVGSKFNKGDILQKSTCYDEYNNRKDGINALSIYTSLGQSEEDGIILCEDFANRIVTPLMHRVSIIANDNDIPLNMFGNLDPNGVYKILPDIGESVPDGILCAIRRKNKEEILYSQTYVRLKDIMMSDDKYTTNGKVVDINIYCNNPELITDNPYYSQIKYYYDLDMQFCRNLVNTINSMGGVYPLSYDLNLMYTICKQKLNGDQYIKDRPFSNVIIDMVLIEDNCISVGDKIADRYGGKGVVVAIWPRERMPMLSTGEVVDMINNKSTCVNRLNAGQCYETSYNHIAQHLLDLMRTDTLTDDECMDLVFRFFHHTNPALEEFTRNYYNSLKPDDKALYVRDQKESEGIYQSLKPISDSCNLSKLNDLYKEFPWITQYPVYISMKDSNGNWRRVRARRPIVAGTKYIYRLKQYAEEKFSSTSLSPTNIKNENSKSRANKLYRDPYTKTPVKFGEMESGNFGHMGWVETIIGLMLYSSSPHARRRSGEELLTGDPFNIDVKLDSLSSNTQVQILNTRFKTIGLRLRFVKKKRELKRPFVKQTFISIPQPVISPPALRQPFYKIDNPTDRDFERMHAEIDAHYNHNGTGLKKPFMKYGFYYDEDYQYSEEAQSWEDF